MLTYLRPKKGKGIGEGKGRGRGEIDERNEKKIVPVTILSVHFYSLMIALPHCL